MTLSPDIWSSYPLYIKNEYVQEIEEANEEIRNNQFHSQFQKPEIQQPVYHVEETRRFERAGPYQNHGIPRKIPGSPQRDLDRVGGGNDHRKLLREREQRFLRNPEGDNGRRIEPYQHKSYARPKILETLGQEISPYPQSHQIDQHPEEIKAEKILTPTKPVKVKEVQKRESPRDSYSLIPPESAYFKVDDPSIQEEKNYDKGISPMSQDSKYPEVGNSFEARARNSKAFIDYESPEKNSKEKKASKWEDINEKSNSPSRKPEIVYPQPHPIVYPAQPLQYPTAFPQNVVYQSPDGRYLAYQHPVPLPVAQRIDDESETRTDLTPPYERHEREQSSVMDRSDDRSFEEYKAKRPMLIQQTFEQPQQRQVQQTVQQPGQQPAQNIIPPYRNPVGTTYVAHSSKLLDLYKKREGGKPPAPISPVKILSPERIPQQEPARAQNILGRPKQPQNQPQVNIPTQVSTKTKQPLKPDPIDIDDIEESKIIKPLEDPEDLQKALISGLRQPDTEPMSLQRFRNKFNEEGEENHQNANDIDRISESNYSVVEQAYKDMDDFDTKVDAELQHKFGGGRVADPRLFRNNK